MVMKPGAAEAARFTYVRPLAEDSCTHFLFPHVVFNRSGYKALLRCRCMKHKILGEREYSRPEEALKAAEVLCDRWLAERSTSYKPP
jgi:hypothetical protein